jgi:hypothetical protein
MDLDEISVNIVASHGSWFDQLHQEAFPKAK